MQMNTPGTFVPAAASRFHSPHHGFVLQKVGFGFGLFVTILVNDAKLKLLHLWKHGQAPVTFQETFM